MRGRADAATNERIEKNNDKYDKYEAAGNV